jgi:hypothetical protein
VQGFGSGQKHAETPELCEVCGDFLLCYNPLPT